jgi:hypothetical protein
MANSCSKKEKYNIFKFYFHQSKSVEDLVSLARYVANAQYKDNCI